MRFNIRSLESQLGEHGFKRLGSGKTPEEAITSARSLLTIGDQKNRGLEFYVASGAMIGGCACKHEEDARLYWCYVRGTD